MIQIPVLSRLKASDYVSIGFALLILIAEGFVRFVLYFFPCSFVDYLRYHLFSRVPRIFRGWQDNEIPELGKYKRTAKEFVEFENSPYRLEEYAVFVPDRYVIILHRLCFAGNDDGSVRPPVLLNHGAMMTSEAWLVSSLVPSPKHTSDHPNTLPHTLLHAGYDVWLMNRRGNKYSCKNTRWTSRSREFWAFSLDEPICRDLPAVIDFVLDETRHEQLSLMGFSQGAAEILGSLSIVKALNRKVNTAILLAPTTRPRPQGFRSPLVRSVIKLTPELVFLIFGRTVMLQFVPFWQRCLSPKAFAFTLDYSMRWLFGWHNSNIRSEDKAIFFQYLFSYTSVQQIVHWFQIMRAGRFQMFDEGASMAFAPGHIPPAYPLHQVTTPLALFEGTADSLTDPSLKNLPAVSTRVTVAEYEHLDFMWGESLNRKVWPHIVKLLNGAQGCRSLPSPPLEGKEHLLISSFKLDTHSK